MDNLKISVVIPFYNVSEYIERCLLSVLNQTWKTMEIILVNDCSPDNSLEIVERVVTMHTRGNEVRILQHEKNKGVAAARNTGIAAATGDYLCVVDSDDYLPLDGIEQLANMALKDNSDFVIGGYRFVGGQYCSLPLSLHTGIIRGKDKVLSTFVHRKWYVMPWNKLIKRVFILENSLFFQEDILHEDELWSFKLACTAQSMSVLNQITYNYVIRPNSMMRAPSLRSMESRIAIISYYYNYIKESERLSGSRDIYMFFENAKARNFDRVLNLLNDVSFHRKGYSVIREKKCYSAFKALFRFYPSMNVMLRNIHYALPFALGFNYYTSFVRLSYYALIVSIKIKQLLRRSNI